MKFSLIVILIFWLLIACHEQSDKVECWQCDPQNYVGPIAENVRVVNSGLVFGVRTLGGTGQFYKFCDSVAYVSKIEESKIIDIQGVIFGDCSENSVQRVGITDYSIVESCQETIDTIRETYDLTGTWFLLNITHGNDTIYPPCEAFELPDLTLQDIKGQYWISLGLGENGCGVELSNRHDSILIDNHSISIPDFGLTCTLSFPKTEALREFERSYSHTFGDTLSMISFGYSIHHNFLTLQNKQNSAILNYYKN